MGSRRSNMSISCSPCSFAASSSLSNGAIAFSFSTNELNTRSPEQFEFSSVQDDSPYSSVRSSGSHQLDLDDFVSEEEDMFLVADGSTPIFSKEQEAMFYIDCDEMMCSHPHWSSCTSQDRTTPRQARRAEPVAPTGLLEAECSFLDECAGEYIDCDRPVPTNQRTRRFRTPRQSSGLCSSRDLSEFLSAGRGLLELNSLVTLSA